MWLVTSEKQGYGFRQVRRPTDMIRIKTIFQCLFINCDLEYMIHVHSIAFNKSFENAALTRTRLRVKIELSMLSIQEHL